MKSTTLSSVILLQPIANGYNREGCAGEAYYIRNVLRSFNYCDLNQKDLGTSGCEVRLGNLISLELDDGKLGQSSSPLLKSGAESIHGV